MTLQLITEPQPIVQTDTRAAVLRGERDTRVFQRVLDFGEGLNGPSDRAIAAFHALYGGNVDTGILGRLARGPVHERARRTNLVRSQHAPKSNNLLQNCGRKQQRSSKLMESWIKKIDLYFQFFRLD